MRRELETRRRGFVHRFKPHGLPNAAVRRVPIALGLVPLLADRLRAVVRRIVDGDDQLVLAVLQRLRHVEPEGVIAAVVPADALAVDVGFAPPVDSLEVQAHMAALPALRQGKGAAILHVLHPLHDARQRALDGIRHENLARQLTSGLHGLEDGFVHALPVAGRYAVRHARRPVELPDAVEVQPFRAHQLRTRILRQHVLRRHVVRPLGHDRRRLLLPRQSVHDRRRRQRRGHPSTHLHLHSYPLSTRIIFRFQTDYTISAPPRASPRARNRKLRRTNPPEL